MNSTELFSEWVRANARLSQSYRDNLKSRGVSSSAWFGSPSLVGAARLQEADADRYVPGDTGPAACVVPVFDGGTLGELWALHDLVAFTLDQPSRWWLRRGVGVLLGPDWPDYRVTLANEPLPLFSTPLDWLRAGGRGSCVVDWSAHLPLHLGSVENIVCDTPELASRLYAALNSERSGPSIHVAKGGCNVAA